MRPVTTISLLLLAAAAIALVLLFERRKPGTDSASARSQVVLEIPARRIDRIAITNAAGRIVLDHSAGNWRVSEPFSDRADPLAVNELLDLAGGAGVIERVPPEEVQRKRDLKEFGLDADNYVKVTFSGPGGEAATVLVGKATAYQDSAYVRVVDRDAQEGEVVVARTKVRPVLTRAPGEFRDPRLIETAAAEIARISITTEDGGVELTRDPWPAAARQEQERPWWRLTQPIQDRADPEVIDRLVAGLVSARAEGFQQNAGGVAPLPANPVVRVVVHADGGSTPEETLEIFAGTEPDTSLVRSSLRQAVARAGGDLLALRLCNAERLRDTKLAALDPRKITTVNVLDEASGPASMHLFNNRWYLRSGDGFVDANRDRIDKLIKLMNDTTYIQAIDSPEDPAAYGLARPILEISFGTPAHPGLDTPAGLTPENSLRVRFGEMNKRFFAKWDDRPALYRVDGTMLGEIPRGALHYRSVRVLAFPPLGLRSLWIAHPPAPPLELAFDLSNEAAWTARRQETDVTALLNRPRLDRLVNRLSELSAQDWLSDPSAAATAFETPALSLRLEIETLGATEEKPGRRTVVLEFAPMVKSQATVLYFGRIAGEPNVFTIRRELFNDLAAPALVNDPEAGAAEK